MKNNIVKMSLAAAMLLSSAGYAGKIIGVDAGTPYDVADPLTQYSFGGWNFDNVNVKITDLEFVENLEKEFYTIDGTYSTMTYGDTFESEIKSRDGNDIVMGLLHGKNWPVGEPAGIKIINDDRGTAKSGKSSNCIMTTSYLDANATGNDEPSGYLDTAFIPVPTVCSSPFQTHKRFKINMTENSIAEYNTTSRYANPIDLVFNLDTNDRSAAPRRYQVFQKINNYTGMRLEGYKIEVLDENGTINPSADIKFSLDLSTKPSFDEESGYQAVFSNGLWGPKDDIVRDIPHFTEDGFFDKVRAGFTQEGNGTATVTGGPDTLNSNYVDLFGIWLPSKWAPYGIFWDDDNDTTTDNELVAFWGDPLATGTNAWHRGNDYNETDDIEPWELVTATELEEWNVNDEGSLYTIGKIEDTLNLGLNYVVEVGENKTIGKTFTIRITPRVAPLEAQTPPSYIDDNDDYILPPELIVPVTPPSTGGGGGGCTYNPNSKNFDMTFLLMMALGLLYPFRRRFLK
ncbi:choice-of-anchor F family protein [Campylobacterota bacterium]